MISAGTAITFDVQGTTGPYLPRTVAGVRSEVIDTIAPFFDVIDLSLSTSSVLTDPLHSLSTWPYRATLTAAPRSDYEDIRDVDSVVAHGFYEATGELPTVTASGYEQGQGAADNRAGLSLTTALVLIAVALVALAVVKVS